MYSVETYDAGEAPGERQPLTQGVFASAADALAAARKVIESNLSLSLTAGLSAADAFDEWRQFGDVPTIIACGGAMPIEFDPFSYARERARELHRRV
jgi:hypothetical protein